MTSAPVRSRERSPVRTLEVRLRETLVGALTHLGNEALIFTFDRAYVEAASDRPTLSLSFKSADGGLVEQTRPTHVRLPPFFSNLLPEAHLRDYLATRGGIHPDREFFLIWLLGTDLPGAIDIHSVDGASPPAENEAAPGVHAEEQPFRFSLAGVQLKFSALMETSNGLTLPVGGVGGDWIVKLPSPRVEAVPENEFAMMTLAKAVGIDVPDVQLVATKDIGRLPQDLPEAFGQSLAVRRFDRPRAGERVHIEDFAQVFGVYPESKYQKASYGSIARVLWLEAGEEAVTEYTRRLVFNVLIGNADAHLKNWSLIYPDRRTPKLAPAYDLIGTPIRNFGACRSSVNSVRSSRLEDQFADFSLNSELRGKSIQPQPSWAVGRAALALIFSDRRSSSDREVIPRARPAEVSLQAARASC